MCVCVCVCVYACVYICVRARVFCMFLLTERTCAADQTRGVKLSVSENCAEMQLLIRTLLPAGTTGKVKLLRISSSPGLDRLKTARMES